MRINYITCSDPRDHNSYDGLMSLWQMDPFRVELAVQMHPGKVSPGTKRYDWVRWLVADQLSREYYPYNFAIHVNSGWCHNICNGIIPDELRVLFDKRWRFDDRVPVVKRIQLNMPRGTADALNPHVLKDVIESFPNQEFIIQYNGVTEKAVKGLHEVGAKFNLLFDSSGGRGITSKSWSAPVYPDCAMGYSGGLSPENVEANLDKISAVAPHKHNVWIDAEGRLKTDDMFDVERARQYIRNAEAWHYNYWCR